MMASPSDSRRLKLGCWSVHLLEFKQALLHRHRKRSKSQNRGNGGTINGLDYDRIELVGTYLLEQPIGNRRFFADRIWRISGCGRMCWLW